MPDSSAKPVGVAAAPDDAAPASSRWSSPALPSWLASMIVHMGLMMVLSLQYFPLPVKPALGLNARVVEDQLEPLDQQLLDTEVTSVELEDELPIDQLVSAGSSESLASSIDVAAFAEPSLSEVENGLMPFAADVGLLESIGDTVSYTAGGFGGRGALSRAKLVRLAGGNTKSEKSVEESLNWLARHQHPEGYWSFDHRLEECKGDCDQPGSLADGVKGATGLALLPFLGAGNTHRDGRHKKIVERGIRALAMMVEATPGGGSLYDGGQMYSHGIASMALCEAYAMTGDERLRAPAQAALVFIANAQDPKGGGWRYEPRQPGDTSVMGWQIGALKSGYLAELEVPPIVPARANYFLDSVQRNEGETYAYVENDKDYRPATTAIGLLCRMYLGAPQDHPVLARGVERLSEMGPSKKDAYFNYYATQVVFQYTSGKGPLWTKWNKAMRDMLIETQQTKGHAEGSWVPADGDHGKGKGGRLYATALNCMTLEVYYRLLPIYQQKAFEEFDEEE